MGVGAPAAKGLGTTAATLAGVGSGLMAGVQFAVALSVVPTLATLKEDDAVHLHSILGRHYDPTMPIVGLTTIAADLVGARVSKGTTRVALIAAAVAMLGVSTVSHLGNVPVNRRIRARDAGEASAEWVDPRPRWRTLHLIRTSLAVGSLALTSFALSTPD